MPLVSGMFCTHVISIYLNIFHVFWSIVAVLVSDSDIFRPISNWVLLRSFHEMLWIFDQNWENEPQIALQTGYDRVHNGAYGCIMVHHGAHMCSHYLTLDQLLNILLNDAQSNAPLPRPRRIYMDIRGSLGILRLGSWHKFHQVSQLVRVSDGMDRGGSGSRVRII